MNVERELADVRRKVQLQIDASADAALVRLGFDPVAEREKARAEAYAASLDSLRQSGMEFGKALAALRDSMVEAMRPVAVFAEGFARGGAR